MFKMRGVKLSKYALLWVPVILLPAALLALPTMANADGGDASLIHACVKKHSELVRIVGEDDRCHHSETPVHWSKDGGGLTVVDKFDKTLGQLIGQSGGKPTVVLTVGPDHFFVVIEYGDGGFPVPNGFTLYYQGSGCSGSPLMDPLEKTDFFPTLKVSDRIGYYGGRDPQTYQVASMNRVDSFGKFQCSEFPQSRKVTPAKTVDLTGFTSPFSVK